ncbi:hypothetical protein BKA70DRAFT_123075 [Coprinopsis sp. MPI-PUGE-AT-0042]|nr:hypothetical protein BKA70DRAFT_123075 [Coprinopsis sp. MPI-PUGE-AT-0042]
MSLSGRLSSQSGGNALWHWDSDGKPTTHGGRQKGALQRLPSLQVPAVLSHQDLPTCPLVRPAKAPQIYLVVSFQRRSIPEQWTRPSQKTCRVERATVWDFISCFRVSHIYNSPCLPSNPLLVHGRISQHRTRTTRHPTSAHPGDSRSSRPDVIPARDHPRDECPECPLCQLIALGRHAPHDRGHIQNGGDKQRPSKRVAWRR